MEINYQEILEILKLVDASEYGEIQLEVGPVKVHARKQCAGGGLLSFPGQMAVETKIPPRSAEVAGSASAATLPSALPIMDRVIAGPIPEDNGYDGLVEVRASTLGTFYRRPSPEAKPFVEVGDFVRESDVVCLVEVMKLFNSIPAGARGRIAKILAEDGQMVEYDQPVMLIEPGESK